ncbi:MAG: hypothetical protein JXI33_00735 [Candidatus Aminicenantes bacterium]|nr:hypothetical protein [Candidatus Aminicenantes bacterium]
MNSQHLHDDQIQEILDNMVLEAGQFLPEHVKDCASCRERFEQYQKIYTGLAADPGFVLPPAFADSVLLKIPSPRPAFWARPAVWIPGAAGVLTLVLAALLMFINMKPLAVQFGRYAAAIAVAFQPLLSQFRHWFAMLNGYPHVFILGGLGLLSAFFFDRILQRQAWRRTP